MSDVVNLQGLVSQKSEQARAENMQRRLLSAQLAAQVISGIREPGQVDVLFADLALTIDNFLKVAEG